MVEAHKMVVVEAAGPGIDTDDLGAGLKEVCAMDSTVSVAPPLTGDP